MFHRAINASAELRQLRLEDAEELYAAADRNRAHLRTFLPWVDPTRSVDDTRAFLHTAQAQADAGEGFTAGLVVNGAIAGCIGLHRIDWPNRNVSLGYWIDERHQGRGLITAGCRLLIDHIVSDLKLNRVEIRCAVENRRSRAIPERLGFRQEGVLLGAQWVNDRFLDLVVYGLLAAEWRPSSSRM